MLWWTLILPLIAAIELSFDEKFGRKWTNELIERTIDVSKSYTKEVVEISAKNIHSEPNSEYYYPIPKQEEENYALIIGTYGDSKRVLSLRVLNNTADSESKYNYLVVDLPAPVAPKSEFRFVVQFIHLNWMKPSPDVMDLNAEQSVVLELPRYIVSGYSTKEYRIAVVGPESAEDLDDFSGEFTVETGSGHLLVAPKVQHEIEPFSEAPLSLKFRKNVPFVVAETLKRDVWVSHWGDSVSFEEKYEVVNKVAKLKGGFSRLNWMQSRYSYQPGPYVMALDMELPRNFREAYYVDLVGNVSTSKMVGNHLVAKPRYPLFGDWHYNFTVGWSNDLSQFVRNEGDEYFLRVPILNGHSDMSYSYVEISFYLPENAKFVDFKSPIPYEEYFVSTQKSFLDYKGHTKVTVVYRNLVDEFKKSDLVVKYEYRGFDYAMKPVIIGGFVFIAMVSYWILAKIDISIEGEKKAEKKAEEKEEKKEKVEE